MSDSEEEEVKLDAKGRPIESESSESEDSSGEDEQKMAINIPEYSSDESWKLKKNRKNKKKRVKPKEEGNPVHAYMTAPQTHVYYPDYKNMKTLKKGNTKSVVFPGLYVETTIKDTEWTSEQYKQIAKTIKDVDGNSKVAAFTIYKKGDQTVVENVEMWRGSAGVIRWTFGRGRSKEFKACVDMLEVRARKFLDSRRVDKSDGEVVWDYRKNKGVTDDDKEPDPEDSMTLTEARVKRGTKASMMMRKR